MIIISAIVNWLMMILVAKKLEKFIELTISNIEKVIDAKIKLNNFEELQACKSPFQNFVESLTHDEIVRLNASLRLFIGYESSMRDAYQYSLVKFPDTQDELQQNIEAVFSMSGTDFFNN